LAEAGEGDYQHRESKESMDARMSHDALFRGEPQGAGFLPSNFDFQSACLKRALLTSVSDHERFARAFR